VTEGLKIQKKRRMHNCIANCNTWHNNHFFCRFHFKDKFMYCQTSEIEKDLAYEHHSAGGGRCEKNL